MKQKIDFNNYMAKNIGIVLIQIVWRKKIIKKQIPIFQKKLLFIFLIFRIFNKEYICSL